MTPASGERPPATLAEARAVAHPVRLRIIRLCKDGARTNRELAALLGLSAGTTLHHVRTLVATGFLVPQPPRPGPRGTTEKPYRSTDKSWRLELAGSSELPAIQQAMLVAVGAELAQAGDGSVLESARVSMRLTADGRDRLLGELREVIDRYANRDEPGGDPLGMLVVVHHRDG